MILKDIRTPPLPLFFPLGVVKMFSDGHVEPVLDPECRHEIQCTLTCANPATWTTFLAKIASITKPNPINWYYSIRSFENPMFEVAAVLCNKKGQIETKNKYAFV